MCVYLPSRDEVDLIFTRVTAEAHVVRQLYTSLSSDERDRAARFCFDKDRNSFIIARGLLRLVLGRHLNLPPEVIRFSYDFHGKPRVADVPNIKFNVSHSEGAAFHAVGRNHEIGADIERIRPLTNLEAIARRYFCHAEYCDLLSTPAEQRLEAFFHCWTRKEAFVKAIGEGLSYPLNQFQVTLRPDADAKLVSIEGSTTGKWLLHAVTPWPTYVAAVAVEDRHCRFRILKFETPADVVQTLP